MQYLVLILPVALLSVQVAARHRAWPDSVRQEEAPAAGKKFTAAGYVKNMQSLQFSSNFKNLYPTNLIHNRINTRWMTGRRITWVAEFRNRLLWGDDVKLNPGIDTLLRNPGEVVNLSAVLFSNEAMVMHAQTDRLYVNYEGRKLSVRAGRQRINWGISTIWNPNDVFNSYNFLDFDYEERPGSDALKVTLKTGRSSGMELALTPNHRKKRGKVLAGRYFFNTRGFDIQLISGLYDRRFTAGLGWAGSVGKAGFKGEAQYFAETGPDRYRLNLTAETDYVFRGGWYAGVSLLFASRGISRLSDNPAALKFTFTPLNLMPTKWNFAATARKEINPLLSASLSVLYAPGTHLMLLLPGIRYSLGDNLDADLIWQAYFARTTEFRALNHRGFIRLKYSF